MTHQPAHFALGDTWTERGAKRPWLAQVTGTDSTYGMRREFLRPIEEGDYVRFAVTEPGLYQFDYFLVGEADGINVTATKGFRLITETGVDHVGDKLARELAKMLAKGLPIY